MILGTAGHIDHGKTTLVKALTGVDTDRLPEEKRRGITIDLGFAPLVLPDGRRLGVVDVPGHEGFVRTMVAGATGMDMALLVVAADEGVMPQTREHLDILKLLGVRRGVVALTKCDLVEADWLEMVKEDIRQLCADSPLAVAEIVSVSATRRFGLENLVEALKRAADSTPARITDDIFRMPVDRSFTIRGTGTVVTGTVWSGTLSKDSMVYVLPSGLSARVRGIEVHGEQVSSAAPGNRTAVALSGVDRDQVARGSVLVTQDGWRAAQVLRAHVWLLEDAGIAPGPRTVLRLHLATTEVAARVVARTPLGPGRAASVRIVSDAPLVSRSGDRFVLRAGSPPVTIGGGVVLDPMPDRRRVPLLPDTPLSADELLRFFAEEVGVRGVEVASLPVRLGVPPARVEEVLAGGVVTVLAGRAFARSVLDELRQLVLRLTREHHDSNPLEPGVSLQAVRSLTRAPAQLVDRAVEDLREASLLEGAGGVLRLPGWTPRLSDSQRQLTSVLQERLSRAGREPPSVSELAAAHGAEAAALLRHLEREGRITPVEDGRYYDPVALDLLVSDLRMGMQPGRAYSPAELRDILGVSRKYLIPFLEYCDRRGVTERTTQGRILRIGSN